MYLRDSRSNVFDAYLWSDVDAMAKQNLAAANLFSTGIKNLDKDKKNAPRARFCRQLSTSTGCQLCRLCQRLSVFGFFAEFHIPDYLFCVDDHSDMSHQTIRNKSDAGQCHPSRRKNHFTDQELKRRGACVVKRRTDTTVESLCTLYNTIGSWKK